MGTFKDICDNNVDVWKIDKDGITFDPIVISDTVWVKAVENYITGNDGGKLLFDTLCEHVAVYDAPWELIISSLEVKDFEKFVEDIHYERSIPDCFLESMMKLFIKNLGCHGTLEKLHILKEYELDLLQSLETIQSLRIELYHAHIKLDFYRDKLEDPDETDEEFKTSSEISVRGCNVM